MASELANRIAYAVLAVDADQPSSEIAIDRELQEVREVLDMTSKRHLPDGPCWCKSYLPTLGHTEDCQRARDLMRKLEVRP